VSRSLQFRLGLASLLVLLLFVISSAAVLDNAFGQSARLALRERMTGQLYLLLSAATFDHNGNLAMPAPADLPEAGFALANSGLYALVADRNRVVWRSPSWLDRPLPPLFPVTPEGRDWRELTLEDGRGYTMLGYGFDKTTAAGTRTYGFYLVAELEPLQQEIANYRRTLWAGLGAVALLLIATQAAALRWSLRPLRQIAGELAAIEDGRRSRIDGDYPAEIRPLTENINLLLSSECARRERYRNAMADLAHSLKTPLAVLRGALENRESLPATVAEQSARMAAIIDRQLQRASTAGAAVGHSAVPIRAVAERMLNSLQKVYRDKAVAAEIEVDPALLFRGDEADLMELLGNLLDNACKWCGSAVKVRAWRDHRGLTLAVHDDGPGIEAARSADILQRGARADESAPGHGIGLAVVADIVEAYRGRISIDASPLGGAVVTVQFAD
jgi:two-component system, OmpR family, sensor histidine kinase PhoQ